MHHLPSRLLAFLIASAALAASPARADFMNWSYTTSAVPPGFAVTGPNNNGSGAVQLTPFSKVAGGSTIPVLAYATSATVPVRFDPSKSTYTLTMTITDNTTHDSGSLSFTGAIGGALSPTSSSLTNTFTVLQKSLTLDGHIYTVTLPASSSLSGPLTPQQNITATVSVTNSVASAPEPASLLLGGMGFTALGICGWWRRLRRSEPRPA
jgi:hypothetical protein